MTPDTEASAGPELRRAFKNLVAVGLGQLVGAGLNLLAVVVVARYLGAESYGHYAYILAVAGLLQLLASAGLDQVVTREIAVHPAGAPRVVGAATSVLWVVSAICMAAIAVIAHASEAPPEVRHSLYIAGAGVVAAMQAQALGNVFRALEQMDVTSVGFVLHKVALVALAVGAAALGLGLPGMCAAFALAFGLLWAYYFAMVARHHFWPWPHADVRRWLDLAREAVPLGVAGILRKMTGRIDVLILGALAAPGAVGHFAAAYKIVEGLALVPLTIGQILFPLLSRSARSATVLFETVFAVGVKCLLFLGVPAAIALALSADRVVRLAYGADFDAAGPTLAVIGLSVLALFPSALLPFVFAALRLQRRYIAATAVALAVNAAVDVVLVPRQGALGAAVGLLSGEAAFLAVGVALLVPRALGGRLLARLAWRPLVAGGVMAAVVAGVGHAHPGGLLPSLGVGVLAYAAALVALGAVSRTELALIRRELRHRLGSRDAAPPVGDGQGPRRRAASVKAAVDEASLRSTG